MNNNTSEKDNSNENKKMFIIYWQREMYNRPDAENGNRKIIFIL